jgi:hypothetical protein
MPMSAVFACTPHYVLMDGNRRIGLKVVQSDGEIECSVIYGFSDKGPYDKFIAQGQMALTPYPLVKGYLRNEVAAPGEGLKLVAIDAASPCEAFLQAATYEAVLAAHENRSRQVTTAYELAFDREIGAYRVEASA